MLRLILILSILVVGGGQGLFAQNERLKIVATTTQAFDLVSILSAGVEDVQVTGLMGAGVDPHLYQPTEADVRAMNEADMVVYSGLHLEGQFDAVFEALSEQGVQIFALGKPVKNAGFIVGGFDLSAELSNVDDPHFWFDPRNWELVTLALSETLGQLDPKNADIYAANAAAYILDLQALYSWANTAMRSVDESQRYLVTSHDAFQYFGAAFGWQMFSIQGISTKDEAGVGDIQAVVKFVSTNQIPVIFIESSLPPNAVQAVVAAAQAEGASLRVGLRELYSDAMGERDRFGGTYIGMIAENVYTILQSYECAGVAVSIPEWTLQPAPPADLLAVDCAN